MDSKNFTIGILSTTAVILLVGLVIINTRPEPASASGMTVTGGDYVLTVGSDISSDEELLYVVDAPEEKLVVYRFDGGRQQIEVVQGIDLGEMRADAGPSQQPGKKPTRGRRRP